MAELNENVKIKKKVLKLSVRQKVKQHFNLYGKEYNFIISCVENAIYKDLIKVNVHKIIKIKNKVKYAKSSQKYKKYTNVRYSKN